MSEDVNRITENTELAGLSCCCMTEEKKRQRTINKLNLQGNVSEKGMLGIMRGIEALEKTGQLTDKDKQRLARLTQGLLEQYR